MDTGHAEDRADGHTDTLVGALVATGVERSIVKGEVLGCESEERNEAHIVLDGRIEAAVLGHHGPMTVAAHVPRSIIGEMTTLIGGRRSATLRSHPSHVEVVGRVLLA